MRFLNISLFVMILFAVLVLTFNNNENIGPEQMLNNLSNIHETTFNITNTISYSNLYKEDITMIKVIYNIINPIIYGIVVEVNTMIPLAVYVASGSYGEIITKYIVVVFVIYLLFAIPRIITAAISLYFFIKEKKKYKEKVWE